MGGGTGPQNVRAGGHVINVVRVLRSHLPGSKVGGNEGNIAAPGQGSLGVPSVKGRGGRIHGMARKAAVVPRLPCPNGAKVPQPQAGSCSGIIGE